MAWDAPWREAAAARIAEGIIRRAVGERRGDMATRVRAGVEAAYARLLVSPVARDAATGSLGVGVAVVDRGEAHVHARGPVGAFVLAGARLWPLAATGTHARGGAASVVRMHLQPGETVLLVSDDLVRELGPDELKSAALTLHPAAAGERLRRLFATYEGRGSAAVLVVGAEPPPEPQPVRTASTGTARVHPAFRRVRTVPEGRRAALGLLSFTSVIAIVAVLVVVLPRGAERAAAQDAATGAVLATASELLTRAENVLASDRAEALELYRRAWRELGGQADPDPDAQVDPRLADLARAVRAGLDAIHGAAVPELRVIATFDPKERDPARGSLVHGPDGGLYFIDRVASVVTRVDPEDGELVDIVHRGDGPDAGEGRMGRPVQLEGTPDGILILDEDVRPWTWEPGPRAGDGTLRAAGLGDDDDRPANVGDLATYPDPNGFRVYLVDVEGHNIVRYQPTFDGRSFTRSDYLVVDDELVSGFRQLHVDERLYALAPDGIRRYGFGRGEHFRTGIPPDDADARPGNDYQLLAGTDRSSEQGLLYLYDAAWDRIVVFDKTDGGYVRQWVGAPGDTSMDGILALSVSPGFRGRPDTLHWITPTAVLEAQVATAVSPPPDAEDAEDTRRDGRRKGRSR